MATWDYSNNNAVTDNSTAQRNAQSVLFQPVAYMKAQGWTEVNKNSWTALTDLTWVTAGTAHSWILLQSPEGFCAGFNFAGMGDGNYTGLSSKIYFMIDLNASATSYGQCTFVIAPCAIPTFNSSGVVTAAVATTVTGGTATARPTLTNEFSSGLVQWHYDSTTGATTYNNLSFRATTDTAGKGGIIVFNDTTNQTSNNNKAGFFLLPLENVEYLNPPTNTIRYPFNFVFSWFNNQNYRRLHAYGNGASSDSGIFSLQDNNYTGNYLFGYSHDGTTTTSIFCHYGTVKLAIGGGPSIPQAGYGTTTSGGLFGKSDYSAIDVYNTTPGKPTRMGTIPGFGVTGATLSQNIPDIVSSPTRYINQYGGTATAGYSVWLPSNTAI